MGQQPLHRLPVEAELGKARGLPIAFEQAAAFEKPAHALGDAVGQGGELGAGGRLHPSERQCAVHWRTGCSGNTSSRSSAVLPAMRRAPQLGQNPRRLQLKATSCSA